MTVVWIVFLLTALLLAVIALITLRSKGQMAPTFHALGKLLLFMAIVTGIFPTLLPVLGVIAWVGSYLAFVGVMTVIVLARARHIPHNP
jgi:hypothetical protein